MNFLSNEQGRTSVIPPVPRLAPMECRIISTYNHYDAVFFWISSKCISAALATRYIYTTPIYFSWYVKLEALL